MHASHTAQPNRPTRQQRQATTKVTIRNRRLRECARQGFQARLSAELQGQVPDTPPLHSHHATRQSSFEHGWNAVTQLHIARARAQATRSPTWIR